MHYVRAHVSETTDRFVGHCNPLRLSLSAFLYLYLKCQCINAFSRGEGRVGGFATVKQESERGERTKGDERVARALGERCKQHGGGRRGFTGRNRCLLSAPVGLLCNNRPVTLRKCGEAACVCVCMCVCGTVVSLYMCVNARAACLRIINSATSERIELVRREPLAANTRN